MGYVFSSVDAMETVILCALLAAVLYGVGTAFEQHQAAGAPDSSAGRPRLIAAFLALTSWGSPGDLGQGHSQSATGLGAAVTGAAAIVVAVAGLSAAGRRRALLLATAAGLADACMAAVTMALANVSGHGIAAVAGSWPVYALVAGGLCSLLTRK